MEYLNLMKKHNIEPNFYISKEYITNKNFKEIINGNWYWILDDSNTPIFPPIHKERGLLNIIPEMEFIWCNFPNVYFDNYKSVFLDNEYIYSSEEVYKCEGSRYSKFRKNSRKWPTRNENYYYRVTEKNVEELPWYLHSQLFYLLGVWLDPINREFYGVYDILSYINNGDNVGILIRNDDVVGVNIWDSNWKYINYRYIFHLKEPYLDEYMRYLFYQHMYATHSDKLINDGGVLDSAGLQNFKMSLNPVEVRTLHQLLLKD